MRKIASILLIVSITLLSVSASSKCSDDINNKLSTGTICQATDTDCKNSLNTFITCFGNCGNTSNTDSDLVKCVKTNCSNISNATVKSFYNEIITCFNSLLMFSALFVLIALLF
ncbi:transmembrane protein, putative (macronuclear) [Tetrahymena thermophila SB210]|uniref:Transmembrane protein, putative n=1 Tax=Tetrahymena thermophila (strain SB210) TaxID=312017 RepID=Q23BM5_TETTS|nr:transmembrane protein, putative [Tetrahymena thermophila SB210]EAR94093.1 transmembrane protein, putative [Tetrahymena thermophila SB210]|eukprot:XP_001014338.1 transmembrane protein, putative [Tetrahymena thermophila SB210]